MTLTSSPLPRHSLVALVLLLGAGGSSCSTTVSGQCEPGRVYCEGDVALTCKSDGLDYEERTCTAAQVCSNGRGCVACYPGALSCDGQQIVRCDEDGVETEVVHECNAAVNEVCYLGNCINACEQALEERSYMGCEYWAVDLDNAVISSVFNAASQQFSVVVSNPSPLEALVRVEVNDAPPGWPVELRQIQETRIPPQGLVVLNLPPRELDGSPEGEYDTGTHTALSSRAYRITASVPIIAYQFSPLDNVQVFSNDASLLVPKSAIDTEYWVMSWPQTIADTNDPETDFHQNLRAFLTIVGTELGTDVTVTLSTDIVGSPDIPAARRGDTIQVSLGPFDVLNLETGDFGADFTGTHVIADKPIAVFSGSEASDVPFFSTISNRYCCADHLEHQLYPVQSAGTSFVIAAMPSRTTAVFEAGGETSIVAEFDYIRVLATENDTELFTSLPPPDNHYLMQQGQFVTIKTVCDFTLQASRPVFVGQFVAGQATTGISSNLPGGDPSFILVPPIEQWRDDYVFLTPDKYAFDFAIIITPDDNPVLLDYEELGYCQRNRAQCRDNPEIATQYQIYRCQLGYPLIIEGLPPPDNIDPNIQNDGYHYALGNEPFGLIVYGFDKHVSYGYAGGTDLKRINIK